MIRSATSVTRAPGRAAAAFSLVEIMLATLVVAIGMTATLSMLMYSRINSTLDQERARAHQIVCNALDQLQQRLPGYLTSSSSAQIWDNGTPDDTSDDTIGTLNIIIRNTATGTVINSVTPASGTMQIQAEATLTWQGRGSTSGRTMRESVMTYILPI